MVDRYAGEAFAHYGVLRHLTPAQARAELELFDDLVLMKGLRPGEAGRWLVTASAARFEAASVGGWCVPMWL
jgi:hypothetical protein